MQIEGTISLAEDGGTTPRAGDGGATPRAEDGGTTPNEPVFGAQFTEFLDSGPISLLDTMSIVWHRAALLCEAVGWAS